MGKDTKRLILGMTIALAVYFLYMTILQKFYPDMNKPPVSQAPATLPSTTQATTQAASTQIAATQGTTRSTTTVIAPAGGWQARGAQTSERIELGSAASADKNWRMQLSLSPGGAGIDSVVLNDFRRTAEDKVARYSFQQPLIVEGNERLDTRSMMTRTLFIDGNAVDLSGVNWRREKVEGNSVTFSVDILQGETEVAKLHKTYTITPRSDDPKTNQGFEVGISHRIENLTDKPIKAAIYFNGPTVPPRELERQPDQNLLGGYWKDGIIAIESHVMEGTWSKDSPWRELTKDEKGRPMVWVGTQSAYFNALVLPTAENPADGYAKWMFKVYGELLNPSQEKTELRRVAMRMETGGFDVPAKGEKSLGLNVYLGPKGRKVLKTDFYTALPRAYDETLVISGGFCGICTWSWLINVLVWLLTLFHAITFDWGVAIILLVVLVRALLHPITKKSQVHMVKMQKMGPELEKLKKKYADNKEELARAQMAFYKEQGMTPILGCLPMFLQMPIWIALWNSLQSTFELRHSPFLYGFTWIEDLAQPDYLVRFNQPVPLFFGWTLSGINILPLLLAVVFYLQSKLQPKPPTMTKEQEQQQKMMVWMSTLLFPLMLYSGPSGLNLYILTSTAFGIVESKVVRKHIQEREALEALKGPTIVDAPPPEKGGKKAPEEPVKKGWMARLQEKAEQVMKDAEKKKGKK